MKKQKIKLPYGEAIEMGKTAKELIEILKKGNITYPKAAFDALTFLAQRIDALKANDLVLKETVQVYAKEIDELKESNLKLIGFTKICADAIDKLKADETKAVPMYPNVRYGIGVKRGINEWGMIHGPFLTLTEALGIHGHDGECILRVDGQDDAIILEKWENGEWATVISGQL